MQLTSLRAILPIAAATLALSAISCGNKKSATVTERTADAVTEAPFRTDSLSWTDSVTTGSTSAQCTISVGYPADGPEGLVDTLRHWIADQLSGNTFVSPNPSEPYVPDSAMLADGRSLIAGIGHAVLNNALPELREFDSLGIATGMQYEYSWRIAPSYQGPKAITYSSSSYCYLGGAHGGAFYNPQVFRLSDGMPFGWDNMFIPDSIPALRHLVKEGVRTQYFEVATGSAFRDALLVDPDTLPLPQAQSYFTADGIAFSYGQYEIAPYAAGMPSCTLPYSQVRPLMTPEAAALLP